MTPRERPIPEWMAASISHRALALATSFEVVVTRLGYSKARDQATVRARYDLIMWMHETFVYYDKGRHRWYRDRSEWSDKELKGWRRLSRPDIGYILGMDHSAIVYAIKKMRAAAR